MDKVILRLQPTDYTKMEIFVNGSLVATVPIWQVQHIMEEYQKRSIQKAGPDDIVLA